MCASSSGGIRTHSISGSKPKWSASCLPSHVVRLSTQSRIRTCKHSGLSRDALPVGVSRPRCVSSPGGTRTLDRLLVRELPSPLGHRTLLLLFDSNDTPAQAWFTSSCGGRSRTCGRVVQSHAFLPTETTPHREECSARVELASPGWKPEAFAARLRARCRSAEGEGVEPSRP